MKMRHPHSRSLNQHLRCNRPESFVILTCINKINTLINNIYFYFSVLLFLVHSIKSHLFIFSKNNIILKSKLVSYIVKQLEVCVELTRDDSVECFKGEAKSVGFGLCQLVDVVKTQPEFFTYYTFCMILMKANICFC